ncbi:MAG: 3-oxoacyl-ACP reductase FabG [Proteobacteria bacterium]|nr:3-oxoacyl-ACP reductase FabG [Pseudomonadota bacterium]
MKKLENRIALVTGASSGIGEGVAKAFAREGADVAINYPSDAQERNIWRVKDAIEKEGRKALVVKADVSGEDQVKRMVDEVMAAFGRIDILVNNAGVANTAAPIHEMSVQMWDENIAVNLRSVFLCTRYVLPHMYAQDYGKIINNSTQFAYTGSPNFGHYTAAKAGVIALTRTLAMEVDDRNINVNCVAPGATMTPMVDDVPKDKPLGVLARQTKHRFGDVDLDIVPAFVFLASEESRFFSGQTISPNGGDVFL